MDEPGIGDEPPEEIVQRFISLDGIGERLSGWRCLRERGEFSLVVLFEGDAFGIGALEIALHLRIIQAEIKV